jgi:acyl CoA:acetate/3-ketoacid CoA transferase beta subunit
LLPPNILTAGSGGANDAVSGASEVLGVVPQSPLRRDSKVPYITAPGKRVRTLVTTHGLFEKAEGEEELRLTGILEDSKTELPDKIRGIKGQCGWELKIISDPRKISLPKDEELTLLRLFDPQKIFLSESP